MRLRSGYRPRPNFDQPDYPVRTGFADSLQSVLPFLSRLWIPALIFLVPIFYFMPVLYSGWHHDDFFQHVFFTWSLDDFIEKLAMIHTGDLTYPFFRPIVIASYRIDYNLWGDDSFGFHLTNIVLHSINSLLLYFLALKLGFKRIGSAVAALLFGIFPSNPEAVTWISGRYDVLSLTWILVSFHFWCEGRLRDDARWLLCAAAAYLIAILSKEGAAAGLLLIPVIDWLLHIETSRMRGGDGKLKTREWRYGRFRFPLIRHHGDGVGFNWKWYLILLSIFVCVIGSRIWFYGNIGGYKTPSGDIEYFSKDFSNLLYNMFVRDLWILITPINRLIWPDWSVNLRNAYIAIGIVAGLGLFVSFMSSIWKAFRTDIAGLVRFTFGLLWILILILPTAPAYGVDESLLGSRFIYASTAGLALLIGEAVSIGMLGKKFIKWVSIVLLIAVLILSGNALRRHNEVWIEAGEIAAKINAVMEANTADLVENALLITVNYPWLHKGAHCAPLNYELYIEYRHGIKNVEWQDKNRHPWEVDSWWESIRLSQRRPGVGFHWNADTNRIRLLPPIIPRPVFEPGTLPGEILGPDAPVDHPEEPEEVIVLPEPI